jgi:hypothetical protein
LAAASAVSPNATTEKRSHADLRVGGLHRNHLRVHDYAVHGFSPVRWRKATSNAFAFSTVSAVWYRPQLSESAITASTSVRR